MCNQTVSHWLPCRHQRSTSITPCSAVLGTPGLNPYDCAAGQNFFLEKPARGPCPVCTRNALFRNLGRDPGDDAAAFEDRGARSKGADGGDGGDGDGEDEEEKGGGGTGSGSTAPTSRSSEPLSWASREAPTDSTPTTGSGETESSDATESSDPAVNDGGDNAWPQWPSNPPTDRTVSEPSIPSPIATSELMAEIEAEWEAERREREGEAERERERVEVGEMADAEGNDVGSCGMGEHVWSYTGGWESGDACVICGRAASPGTSEDSVS